MGDRSVEKRGDDEGKRADRLNDDQRRHRQGSELKDDGECEKECAEKPPFATNKLSELRERESAVPGFVNVALRQSCPAALHLGAN